VNYWLHTNMLTVNGVRMSKSAGNGFLPEELFAGAHALLAKAYTPMTVRFFMLQTHYRSTLDFSNEALQASEKGLKRLWEAYEALKGFVPENGQQSKGNSVDAELDNKIKNIAGEFDENMSDDFNTAKVLAGMFELVPIINSVKDKTIAVSAISAATLTLLQTKFKGYLEDVFGLKAQNEASNEKLQGIMQLLIDIRKEAKGKKDFATSDKIRKQLTQVGISIKDEKDGGMTWTLE
jgi:cysteinyl-tRNA synthetase